MKIIPTSQIGTVDFTGDQEHWLYNGLDCCVTREVFDVIAPQMDEIAQGTYNFSRSLQAPVLEMNTRGLLVDQERRSQVIRSFEHKIVQLERQLDRILAEGVGTSLNWRSPAQLVKLFYEVMGYPVIRKRLGGPTVDRDALEKLQAHFLAKPIIAHILALRDLGKKLSVLRTEIDPDGRMRTSFNIAGTTTGRFSSALSDFGTGTNLQNITEELRSVFVPDPGMKYANIDLEQGDSRNVGALCWNLFQDGRYLDACESGDLHTAVCRLAWTELPWTGDLKADKLLAEQPFYRHHSYRYMAKRLGHGTNYNGQPYTMSKQTQLEIEMVRNFQVKYFGAFPAIPKWHSWTAIELQTKGFLVTPFGRRRWFFGRRNDDATLREAIANTPQSMTGDEINTGILQVWKLNLTQLLLQVHDSILLQYPEDREDEILPLVLAAIRVPLILRGGREFTVPAEAKVGWNWGTASPENPDGLEKYRGHDERRRSRTSETSLLRQRVY